MSDDIWTTDVPADAQSPVCVSIYGEKRARLWGEPDDQFLWLQFDEHTLLSGSVKEWEMVAEVLNRALEASRVHRSAGALRI